MTNEEIKSMTRLVEKKNKDCSRYLKKQKQQILTLIKEKNKSDNVIENYDDIIKDIEKL